MASSGPGRGSEEGQWEATHPTASCSLPGLSCPKETRAREKRNVSFQKAINQKCELWVPMKLSTWARTSGGGVCLLAPLLPSEPVYGTQGQRPRFWG